jgi:hypothetical protein
MRHSRKWGWSGAGAALLVLALGLVGVALAGGRQAAAAKVTVTLSGSGLTISHRTLQAGQVTFLVVNNDHKLHLVTISGSGAGAGHALSRKLEPGKRATLAVTLRQGAYVLSDRVGSAPAKTRWLVVGPPAATGSAGNAREILPFPAPAPMDCD